MSYLKTPMPSFSLDVGGWAARETFPLVEYSLTGGRRRCSKIQMSKSAKKSYSHSSRRRSGPIRRRNFASLPLSCGASDATATTTSCRRARRPTIRKSTKCSCLVVSKRNGQWKYAAFPSVPPVTAKIRRKPFNATCTAGDNECSRKADSLRPD